MFRKFIILLAVLAAAGGGYYLGARPGGPATRSAPPQPGGTPVVSARDANPDAPIPVVAGVVERKDVPIYLGGIGTVSAFNTVQVKPRIDGQLMEIRFKEGQDVKIGDVLAVIDQRPYLATLKQMQANLAKDRSALANARIDLDRYQKLKDFATRQSVDTQQALVEQTEAQIASDQAQIDAAKTNLDYTTITSPINGRTGIRQVDVGNIVHASDTTPIVSVTQLQPIAVLFTLPADQLPQVSTGLAQGALPVLAFGKDNDTLLATGQLLLADNLIDTTTGTIKLKAIFPNADRALWPGQFVNARLLADTAHGGLVVPATVVQRGPNGSYAWVIAGDDKVEMRPVAVTQVQDGQALIAKGLKVGEAVVVDGQYKLQAGSKVTRVAPSGPAGPA